MQNLEETLSGLVLPLQPRGLYEPVRYTLEAGGKRLRPNLLLLVSRIYGAERQAMPAAVGLEMYHNHTLLHDDLMDNADLRRGRPTVHRKWDTNTAVLSGDVMLIKACHMVASTECIRRDELLDVFLTTAAEVCEGQQYDMNFERRQDVSIAEYLEMIRLKTSVLIACAAKMGAIVGNAPSEEEDLLYAFAERVGLAFQLQDDYLDVYADPDVFGKKIGGDILCGKKTYLLIAALSRSDAQQRKKLEHLLAAEDLADEEKIRAVTALYDELGAGEACRKAVDAYFDDASELYDQYPVSEERKRPLWQWAEELMGRKY